MKPSKIFVLHTSPYSTKTSSYLSKDQGEVLSFQTLKYWVKSGKILFHFFKYRESHLITYDLKLVAKPFILFLIVRLLSRGKALIEDQKGDKKEITFLFLGRLFIKLLKDWRSKRKFMKNLVEELKADFPVSKKTLDITRAPLYLRTDLCFGLDSGGSVGHIAGVLNHLHQFVKPPIFITSDEIPTVKPNWEKHIIAAGQNFWDFAQMPALDYNRVFYAQVLQRMGNRTPSFIYQRYSMNHFSGVKLAHHYDVPFVLEYNGSEVWVNRHWGNGIKYEALSLKIENYNLKAADLIVVVSQPLREELISQRIEPNKILVNPNGVDPEKYSPDIDGNPIRKKLKIEDKIVLGFIGTFGKWHGAEVLAESYGKLLKQDPHLKERVILLLIGDGMTMPIVKKRLTEEGALSHVILTGTVKQEEGPKYLAACDILVSPHVPNPDQTAFFGSPTKLFEYMAMGKGIVASDLDQIGEVLEHGKTAWMVKPGDVESLIAGMKALIENPELRATLGQNARERAVSKHSWKEHTRKIIEKLSHLQTLAPVSPNDSI